MARYDNCHVQKLTEEMREYRAAHDIAELADLVEVIQALIVASGFTPEQFERIRQDKLAQSRGFTHKLLLLRAAPSQAIQNRHPTIIVNNRCNDKIGHRIAGIDQADGESIDTQVAI